MNCSYINGDGEYVLGILAFTLINLTDMITDIGLDLSTLYEVLIAATY